MLFTSGLLGLLYVGFAVVLLPHTILLHERDALERLLPTLEKDGVAVLDDLTHRRRIGRKHGCAARQCIQQRPGEYERIGQIDVYARDLQHRQILTIG